MDIEPGPEARSHFIDILMGKRNTCWLGGDETYNRKVGVCFVGEKDVAATVIAASVGRD